MKKLKIQIRSIALFALFLAMLFDSLVASSGKEMLSSQLNQPSHLDVAADEAYFLIDIQPRKETFTIKLTDPVKIQKARDILSGKDLSTPHVAGTIVKQSACYNPPWSFHFDPNSIEFFASAIEVCDASIAYTESFLDEAGGHFLPGNYWCPWGSRLVKEIPKPVCGNSVTSVSAADYQRVGLASGSIVTAFGNNLATATEIANTFPLPTSLAGTTVRIKDAAGKELLAPLFFVSPGQVNYQVPLGIEPGLTTVRVINLLGDVATEQTQLLSIAPGLFTANANGHGVPAAAVLRIKAGGSQAYEPAARFDPTQSKFVPTEIDLGPASDQVFLILFGTGLRHAEPSLVDARIGDLLTEVAYLGPQPDFSGLDQINLRLPRRLIGAGEVAVNLMIDDQKANSVTIAIK